MQILAVDDERIMLTELTTELGKVFPGAEIHGERDPFAALEWTRRLAAEGKPLHYMFLDIRISGMSGLELAGEIKKIHPRATLIFCTAYTEYAFDAVGMYAKGYLLKPVSAEDIVRTLDEMVYDWRGEESRLSRDIRVQTFGHFEVFVNGQMLSFEREKARELLAYLVDRHGASVTTEQIAAVLWEDKPYGRTLKNYVSTVVTALRNTLRAVGAEDILVKTRNHLAIDTGKIKCDAYDYEKGDVAAVNFFRGEYMANYSWAEFTAGRYASLEQERKNNG